MKMLNDPAGPHTWSSNRSNQQDRTLDLVWVGNGYQLIGNLQVHQDLRGLSDHSPLWFTLDIETIEYSKPTIKRGSKESIEFIKYIRSEIDSKLPKSSEHYIVREQVIARSQDIDNIFSTAWHTFAKVPNRTVHSKSWWNSKCSAQAKKLREMRECLQRSKLAQRYKRQEIKNLLILTHTVMSEEVCYLLRCQTQRIQKQLACLIASDGILNSYVRLQGKCLRGAAARARREFFDNILYKTHSSHIWNAVKWTKPRRQPTDKGLMDSQGCMADTMQQVGELFQEQFTPKDPPQVDVSFIDKMKQLPKRSFPPYGKLEYYKSLAEVSNFSAPGPDNIGWFWIKRIVCLGKNLDNPRDEAPVFDTETPILLLFDACIKHVCYPPFFKQLVMTCVPKPKKLDYTKAKAFRPIVLLNCWGKLKEKMLAHRMQFDSQKFGLMHLSQFGDAIQHGTQDAGTQLVHNIKQMWK